MLDHIASSAPMAAKLGELRTGGDVVFEHVIEAGQPFLAAIIARQAKIRVWIVCRDVRSQEAFHNELLNWFPDALFFPETDVAPVEGAIPAPETAAERLGIVQQLGGKKGREVVVLTRANLSGEVPAPDALKQLAIVLKRSTRLDREKLIRQLAEAGYEHVPQVSARGQFAVRGGILDIYSFHHTLPIRVEMFDDEIESMRHFDLDAQTSVQQVDSCTLLLGEAEDRTCPLRDYMREDDLTIDAGADFWEARVRILEGSLTTESTEGTEVGEDSVSESETSVLSVSSVVPSGAEDYATAFFDHGLGEFEAGDFVVDEIKREQFFQSLRNWRLEGWRVHIFCNNEGEIERLNEIIPAVETDPLKFTIGTLARGFIFPGAKVAVLSDAELFGRYRNNRARRLAMRRTREVQRRAQIDFSELNEDDLVVHLEHGIGRYEGLKQIPRADGHIEEVLVVAFAHEARLYIPLEQSFLLARYVGVGRGNPPLS
ncbi:MAG: CarD family transcriptional regulator, partial [Chthoniobacteraceae bacterium]